ncbi:MAG TPA: FAD-binding oxidoreductase [Mycobacteriales bacterium]|nr:FAD-binding oxidoreductase [Mycobacteriales bacterium]
MTDALAAALRGVVGDTHVLDDRAVVASYESDWTGRFHGRARLVVRPGTTDEVAAVLQQCAAAQVPVCVQGGNTGLVGASVPVDDAVLLSTRRLTPIEPIDEVAAQVTVGAGCPLVDLQQVARAAGLDVGVDFAARESCTVGGMVATNAGGERVLRYGTMRAQVAGIEAVLPDGTTVSRLTGLPKDNTGYDLMSLLAGSEGTLAVITRLRLRLVPLLPGRAVALVAVAGTTEAVELVRSMRAVPSLEAAELFYADGLDLVRQHTGAAAPFAAAFPAYVLVECAQQDDPSDDLLAALEAAGDLVLDATVASDGRGRAALWAYREAHTESINAAGVPVKLDVAVPLRALAETVEALPRVVGETAPQARTILFGHVNEGNLHVNVLHAEAQDEAVTDAVLRLVASHGGSISAEHGVGRAKRAWLSLSRSAAEIEMMRQVKAALDPRGLLNPGVLIDVNPDVASAEVR